ncbi:MAG: hypothetical protein R2724_32105 [Bryobacterales bacterium]
MKMDLATVVGIVLCTILILSAIVLGGSPLMFVDIPSILIVVGTISSHPRPESFGRRPGRGEGRHEGFHRQAARPLRAHH